MEHMFQQRLSQYECQTAMSAACSLVPKSDGRESLSELIWQVLREELQKSRAAASPSVTAFTDVIWNEISQFLPSLPPLQAEPPMLLRRYPVWISTPSTARFLHSPAGTP